jgi:hypothetical protein
LEGTSENWQKYLNWPRPSQHLAMYVDKRGNPLGSIWIATRENRQWVEYTDWQRLASVIFYLAWARIPYITIDRAAAEDFYFETFVVPEGADADSATHVRWSKFGTTIWSDIKIHPALEVSLRGNEIELPPATNPPQSLFYDPTPVELFKRLEKELSESESRLLTGLWFLHQASYRSAYRSNYAEDLQNICSAFEAILDITEKGDSARQVSERLKKLFRPLAPSPIQAALSKRATPERAEVLDRLSQWINELYRVRNDYTRGKSVRSYVFGERSIWQDTFEIFRLAANRRILNIPERHPDWGSMLEKRLMSVTYFDDAVGFFGKKDGEWMTVGKKKREYVLRLKEVIRKSRTLDPQLVESVANLKLLRQSLFNICTKVCRTLEKTDPEKLSSESKSILPQLHAAFDASRTPSGKLDTDAYVRKVTPRLSFWVPGTPMEGRSIALYELVQAFKTLVTVYSNFTSPILNSLAASLPSPEEKESGSGLPPT